MKSNVQVVKAEIMLDPHTRKYTLSFSLCSLLNTLGESRGFGFVKMDNAEDAQAAIDRLNQSSHEGKSITVAHVSLPSHVCHDFVAMLM